MNRCNLWMALWLLLTYLMKTLDDLVDEPVWSGSARRYADFLHALQISRIDLGRSLDQKTLRALFLANCEQLNAV